MGYTLHRSVQIKRDLEEDLHSQKLIDKWIFSLLVAAILLVPLLVGAHVTEIVSPIITGESQLTSGEKVDIFTFYKFIILMILTIAIVGLFLYKLFFLNYSIPKQSILWFFGIFIVAIILSTILSPSKTIALYGQYNRTDGALSYICYVLLLFVAMHIRYPKKVVEYMLYAFYPLVIINFTLITMNFIGHDVMTYAPIKKAMTLFSPEVVLGENSTLLGTLNHWNYMSGMFAIVTVMYLAWVVIDTNKFRKWINLFIALLSVSTMLIAMSASGFVTFVCIIPIILWLAVKSITPKAAFIHLSIFLIFTGGILHVLSLKDSKVWDESIGFFLSGNPYVAVQPVNGVSYTNDQLDSLGLIGSKAFAADTTFKLPELPENNWGPGTGRIYIWQKTLQLVSERPLFGYGLDTLMYNFPHYDIEAQANLNEVTIVDKPHSFYVGIVYGTGIIGLIGFLGVIFSIAWAAVKSIIRYNNRSSTVIILSITWLAFLIQALFNDSLPGTTTPLFIIGGVIMALVNKDIVIKNDDSRID